MSLYSGAIDYMVYKLESKYIIILLDNHNPITYCSGPKLNPTSNIDNLFELFISKDSVFVFEELVPTHTKEKFIELFPQTPHLVKYMGFYSKYKSNKNKIIPIDLRVLFDNFSLETNEKRFELLDQFFKISPCTNPDVQTILLTIDIAYKHNIFAKHFNSLKSRYQELKQMDLQLSKCVDSSYLGQIYLNYPFDLTDEAGISVCEHIEQLLSGLLEMYTIAQILNAKSKYVFVYLGASHCISIGWALEKYYKIRKIKSLDNFQTDGNIFKLNLLDNLTKSCVNFQPI